MHVNSFASRYNLTHDQIKFLEKIQGVTLPAPVEQDLKSELPAVWKFSGCFPFNSIYLPFDLAREHSQNLNNFGYDVFGLILPYPGFDDALDFVVLNQKYLHLFNVGGTTQSVSGTVNEVAFTNVEVYPKKRTVLILST